MGKDFKPSAFRLNSTVKVLDGYIKTACGIFKIGRNRTPEGFEVWVCHVRDIPPRYWTKYRRYYQIDYADLPSNIEFSYGGSGIGPGKDCTFEFYNWAVIPIEYATPENVNPEWGDASY